jgi:hypothetical protein
VGVEDRYAKCRQQHPVVIDSSGNNPLTTNNESCSEWAEIFSIAFSIYFLKIIFYA